MTRCLTLSLSAFALMLAGTAVRADVSDKVKEMQSPKDSKEFAMKAAEGGMLEVKLSQLAQQKSQSQEIKDLAKQLEQDHTQANTELMAAARAKNISLPSELKGEADECYRAFQKLDGQDFDNAYLLFNVKDHLKDVMMFQKEAQNGSDPDIKQWASQTLPKLRQHAGHIGKVAQAAGLPVDVLASGHHGDGAQPAGSQIRGSSGTDSGTRTDSNRASDRK
ncbi:MAG: putative outer membrane protein [Phycisphaerales bacterium]|nr:putative outer membrane protein [Phycisphaerales bacterium]